MRPAAWFLLLLSTWPACSRDAATDDTIVDGGGDAAIPGDNSTCGTMSGAWTLGGMCGPNTCQVSQEGCAVRVLCNEDVDYMGSVTGASFSYSGKDAKGYTHTCSGMIQGAALSGTCEITSSGSCTFSATHK